MKSRSHRRPSPRTAMWWFCVVLWCASSCAPEALTDVPIEPITPKEETAFTPTAKILREHCAVAGCHGGDAIFDPKLGPTDAAESVFRPALEAESFSRQGIQIVEPGDPESSIVFQRISQIEGAGPLMPPGGKLSAEEVEIVRAWIASGASFE